MNQLKLTKFVLFLTVLTTLHAQPNIGDDVLYGYVHDETGLLFVRTINSFYSIDGYSDQYTRIRMGDMERDSIYQADNTPYLFVHSPTLNIIDLTQNEIVFDQQKAGFDKIHQIDLVGELDAFFLVATESSETTSNILASKKIHFYLIDILTGEAIWKYTPDDDQGKFFSATTEKPVVLDSDKVIFPFGNNLYCLDSQLGTQLWKAPFKRPNLSTALGTLFTGQQPSEYFKFGNSLMVFENYKEKKVRAKTLRQITSDGQTTWQYELTKEERMGSIWNDFLQMNTYETTRMIDMNTGKDAWEAPITTDLKYFSYYIHPSQEYILTRAKPKSSHYPQTLNAYDPKTGKSLWKSPKSFPDKKRKVTSQALGVMVYNKEEKELTFFDYANGEPIWAYPKKQMNDYKLIKDHYYVSKDDAIDKLDNRGNKIWIESPPVKSTGIWRIIEDVEHEIIISNKNSSKKTVSVVDRNGKLIKSREWKISDSDSLLFVKFSQEKINYIKFDGIYQLDMSTDDKPLTIAKFSGKDRQYEFNDEGSKIVVRTGDDYHYYDFSSLKYKLLAEKMKFEGDDERRIVQYFSSGISVQNQENIAFLNFEDGIVFNKYFKYPKTSNVGTKLLKTAVKTTSTYVQLHQGSRAAGNEMAYSVSGQDQFANNAKKHNRNSYLARSQGNKLVGKLDELENKKKARQNFAKTTNPVAVFSEKRKVDDKRTVVIINIDPVTGKELEVFNIGEKNPVYYVDPLGGIIFYINKVNTITRYRI